MQKDIRQLALVSWSTVHVVCRDGTGNKWLHILLVMRNKTGNDTVLVNSIPYMGTLNQSLEGQSKDQWTVVAAIDTTADHTVSNFLLEHCIACLGNLILISVFLTSLLIAWVL